MTAQEQIDFDSAGTIKVALGTRLLLDVREAAAVLAIGRSTLYELINAGDLEVVHIGRACRVPAAALVAYVDRLRRLGAAADAVIARR